MGILIYLCYSGNYFLNRECLDPPQALQQMIFPRIEETRSIIENIPISRRDVATQCFLDLRQQWHLVQVEGADEEHVDVPLPGKQILLACPRIVHGFERAERPEVGSFRPDILKLLRHVEGRTVGGTVVHDMIVGVDVGEVTIVGADRAVTRPQDFVDSQRSKVVGMVGRVIVDDERVRIGIANDLLEISVHLQQRAIVCTVEIVEQLGSHVLVRIEVEAVIERDESGVIS